MVKLTIAALVMAAVVAQTRPSLASLTVPPQKLPEGCRLAPVGRDANGRTTFAMYPGIRENPWVGMNRQNAATIRGVVDGPPLVGDELRSATSMLRSAEDVAESYRARYLTADGFRVEVYAVRFVDPALTMRALKSQLSESPNEVIVETPQPFDCS